jgi:hypothetical protein
VPTAHRRRQLPLQQAAATWPIKPQGRTHLEVRRHDQPRTAPSSAPPPLLPGRTRTACAPSPLQEGGLPFSKDTRVWMVSTFREGYASLDGIHFSRGAFPPPLLHAMSDRLPSPLEAASSPENEKCCYGRWGGCRQDLKRQHPPRAHGLCEKGRACIRHLAGALHQQPQDRMGLAVPRTPGRPSASSSESPNCPRTRSLTAISWSARKLLASMAWRLQ